jgi:protein involved in polysaccharide export with SLBB domain
MTSIFVLLLVVQQPGVASAAPASGTPGAPQEYLVGPQDKLDINVIPDVFTARQVTVEVDGTFQYLDIGRVRAQDLTVRQIQAEIRKLLIDRNLHRDPTVTAAVVEFRSKMIYVNGDGVKAPQSFRIQGNDTIMSAIYQAGSFTSKAGSVVTIRRRGGPDGRPMEIQIPRADIEQGTGLAATFHLQDGDLITVPEAGHCFVRGEVVNPGTYDLGVSARTVFDMINAAGGYTKFARKGEVVVRRIVSGRPKEIKVSKDLTDEVQPNDVIEVLRRRW